MALSQQDYELSRLTSRRGRTMHEGLRSLRVSRLRAGAKAILRLPLSKSPASRTYSVYCEKDKQWVDIVGVREHFECPECGIHFRLEYAVFTAYRSED